MWEDVDAALAEASLAQVWIRGGGQASVGGDTSAGRDQPTILLIVFTLNIHTIVTRAGASTASSARGDRPAAAAQRDGGACGGDDFGAGDVWSHKCGMVWR